MDRNALDVAKSLLEVLVSVCVVVTCGVALWIAFSPAQEPRAGSNVSPASVGDALPAVPISIGDSVSRGDPAAPVVVIEYSEFQCPYCKRFADTSLHDITATHITPGLVQWVFRHFPLEAIHQDAFAAAEAAECAGQQGRFWEMHQELFSNQTNLTRSLFDRHARTLKLDPARFSECMSGQMSSKIRGDMKSGEEMGVRGTPTFLIGTRTSDGAVRIVERISGAVPADRFRPILDSALGQVATAD